MLNTLVCAYGLVLSVMLIAEDLERTGALRQQFRTKGGSVYTLGDSWVSAGRWVLVYYPKKFVLSFFLVLVTSVAAAFTSFQVRLLAINVTTNETFKRSDLMREGGAGAGAGAGAGGKLPNLYDRGIAANVWEGIVPLTCRAAPPVR